MRQGRAEPDLPGASHVEPALIAKERHFSGAEAAAGRAATRRMNREGDIMSIMLTRKRVSALAKLDFSGKSHCQRVDMIAAALGAKNQASLMAVLKAQEDTAHEPLPGVTDKPAMLRSYLVLTYEGDSNEPYYTVALRQDVLGEDGWSNIRERSALSRAGGEFLMNSGLGVFLEAPDGSLRPTERRDDHGLSAERQDNPHGEFYIIKRGNWPLFRIGAHARDLFLDVAGIPLKEEPVDVPAP